MDRYAGDKNGYWVLFYGDDQEKQFVTIELEGNTGKKIFELKTKMPVKHDQGIRDNPKK